MQAVLMMLLLFVDTPQPSFSTTLPLPIAVSSSSRFSLSSFSRFFRVLCSMSPSFLPLLSFLSHLERHHRLRCRPWDPQPGRAHDQEPDDRSDIALQLGNSVQRRKSEVRCHSSGTLLPYPTQLICILTCSAFSESTSLCRVYICCSVSHPAPLLFRLAQLTSTVSSSPLRSLDVNFSRSFSSASPQSPSRSLLTTVLLLSRSVVSQVNPHVHLFFFAPKGSPGKPSARVLLCTATELTLFHFLSGRPVAHRKGKGWRGGFVLSAMEQYLKLELVKVSPYPSDRRVQKMQVLTDNQNVILLQNFKVIRDLELMPELRSSLHSPLRSLTCSCG
jgi:hypothetical protein